MGLRPRCTALSISITLKQTNIMEQSNITYDHIALEAMKIIMQMTTREMLTPLNRLKRWLGIEHTSSTIGITYDSLAAKAHDIADAMVAERERRGKVGNTENE